MYFLTFIYYNDLKIDFVKILKNIAIYKYIMNTIKQKNKLEYSFAFKIGLVWSYYHKYGVISAKKSAEINEKREKVL